MTILYDKKAINTSVVLELPCLEGSGLVTQDVSKYHNSGVFGAGAPTWTQLASGEWVLTFAGAEIVSCGDGTSMDITDVLTLIAWVRLTAVLADYRMVMGRDDGTTRNYAMFIPGPSQYPTGLIRIGGVSKTAGTATALVVGTFGLCGVTYDGAQVIGWLNAVPGAPTATTGAIDNGNISMCIGAGAAAWRNINAAVGRPRAINRAVGQTEWSQILAAERGFYGV